MTDHIVTAASGALTLILRRGERMCLIGMNVDPKPNADFVGFAIEWQPPGAAGFTPLKNRLAFSYPPAQPGVDGNRNFPSTEAPFQTFRWIHFPQDEREGIYSYRVSMIHTDGAGTLASGDSATGGIALFNETLPGIVDIGFTRNFASSQAFADRFPDSASRKLILPLDPKDGLQLDKSKAPAGVYDWLGSKSNDLLNGVLGQAVGDPSTTLDVMAYDLNEPDFLAKLEAVARRGTPDKPSLRILIDDSKTHIDPGTAESQAAKRLTDAGASVRRHHFFSLQHNKVIILHKEGKPLLAIGGSTNFSFRGLYIQANNLLLFRAPDAVALFAQAFELGFAGKDAWQKDPFRTAWHTVSAPAGTTVRTCHSPHHQASAVSLTPVTDAIGAAASSVLYAVAFLNQDTKGPVRKALDLLQGKPLFSYGIVNRDTGLKLMKPDGTQGVVDFQFLADHAPEPFKSEWSGGAGINIHHKFVVTDFSLPTACVFAGSSNLSFSGEEGNGDHLVEISDSRVATAYAIEALRMFDHLHFRTNMKAAQGKATVLTLRKPPAAGELAWFEPSYVEGSQKARDRMLFGSA